MKGVGFQGTPFPEWKGEKAPKGGGLVNDKEWAISPDGFSDVCYFCGIKFAENEGNAVIRVVDGKMTSQRRHRGCPEPKKEDAEKEPEET